MVLLFIALVVTGCAIPVNQGNSAVPGNAQNGLPQETPYIIYVTATAEQPNVIYVTATPEQQNTEIITNPAISNSPLKGKIVYSKFISRDPVDAQIFMMSLDNGVEKQITFTGINAQPMWSPDGTKILYTSSSGGTANDIFIMDENGENARAIVTTAGMDINAVWSPDGKMVAYNSDVDGNHEIYTLNVETNQITQITSEESGYHGSPSWSPDGKKIVYVYGDGIQYGTKLFIVDMESGMSQEIDQDKFYLDDMPAWSADGQSILFARINGEFQRIIRYDLNQMEENLLTEEVFPSDNKEYLLEKSAHGNFVSFSENGKFYIMELTQQLIYPLGGDASDLHYFPE
jgi:TolB protein